MAETLVKQAAEAFSSLSNRPTIYSLLLPRCRPMRPAELDEAELSYLDRLMSRFEAQAEHCYRNSQLLMLFDIEERLRYHEGFMVVEGASVPILHAWVSINGKVADSTSEAADKHIAGGEGSKPRRDYFGVEISRDEVLVHVAKTGVYEALTMSSDFMARAFASGSSTRKIPPEPNEGRWP